MNKSPFSYILVFALGAGASFLVTKKLLEEKYAQLAQEEIDSVKEIFGRHFEPCDADDNRADGIGPGMESEFENGMTEEQYETRRQNPSGVMARSSLNMGGNKSEQAKQNYNLIKPAAQEDEEDSDVDSTAQALYQHRREEEDKEMDLTGIDRTVPYLINDREYSEEFEHHEKVSLYYYTVDDVLCNENEEPIEDVEETVGYDCFKVLEREPSVWVRNEPLGIDYEICAVRNSYAQVVHGININENLSPRERYMRNQNRRENGGE